MSGKSLLVLLLCLVSSPLETTATARFAQQLPDNFTADFGWGEVITCQPGEGAASGLLIPQLFAGGRYDSMCRCTENSNLDSVEAARSTSEEDFFDAFSELKLEAKWECQNQCATCVSDGITNHTHCGMYSGTNVTSVQGRSTTLDHWLSTLREESPVPLDGYFGSELCFEYTEGEQKGDTVCMEGQISVNLTGVDEFPTCVLRYNGQECHSCSYYEDDITRNNPCVLANCSNLGEQEMVDGCNFQTRGKFLPLFVLENEGQLTLAADCAIPSSVESSTVAVAVASALGSLGVLSLLL